MQSTERSYAPKKIETLRRLNEYSKKYSVIAVSKIRKVRARQMMTLRKQFRNELKMIVAKNKIFNMGLKGTKENIEPFLEKIIGQNAMIFTNMNPFKLQLTLDKNKIDLPARAGDLATDNVILPAANTGMPPGPILSEFKELKVPTKIDAGSIFITRDTEVLKAGEQISPKLAGLLSKLGLKPIKAGLSLAAAHMDGVTFNGEDLQLNLEEYGNKIREVYKSSLALGVVIRYLTKETTPIIIGLAQRDAQALILEAAYVTKETLPNILTNAEQNARALLTLAKPKGYY